MVRGDVHAINLPHRRGRAQHGDHYAVIVQADDLLALSTVVTLDEMRAIDDALLLVLGLR